MNFFKALANYGLFDRILAQIMVDQVSKDYLEVRGEVEELLPGAKFKIKLENGQTIIGHLSGKMRMNRIRLLPGDEVKVEISLYDLTKGRVVYRF